MLNLATKHAGETPVLTCADDRLHNSGWGRPSEQYRTPAIGAGLSLDLHRTLLSWGAAPVEVRVGLRGLSPVRRRYPREVTAQCAIALVSVLGGDVGSDSDAHSALTTLSAMVIGAGLTDGILLTCGFRKRGTDAAVFVHEVTAEQAALTLVACACARPPTVMWGIEPSLEAITAGGVLDMRWLRRTAAGAAARSAWEQLTRTEHG